MSSPPTVGDDSVRSAVAASISIRSGRVRRGALSVYSVMRNEMYLLPAFLEHYRAIGAEQFIILSDRSDDGTTEFLLDQADCVVLHSTYAYGAWLDMPPGSGVRRRRAGVLMKAVIPRLYLDGTVGIYADADEFLILPSSMTRLTDAVRQMAQMGANATYASMVEMYPGRIDELLQESTPPNTFRELLEIAPFFDGHPLLRLEADDARPTVVGTSASSRLFRHYAIGQRRRVFDPTPLRVRRLLTTTVYSSAVYKTPIVNFQEGVDLTDSHHAGNATYSPLLVGLLHFKFTPDSLRKVPRIIAEKSHSRQSRKYVGYELLFEEMRRSGGSFLGPDSTRYEGARSLEAVGLIRV